MTPLIGDNIKVLGSCDRKRRANWTRKMGTGTGRFLRTFRPYFARYSPSTGKV